MSPVVSQATVSLSAPQTAHTPIAYTTTSRVAPKARQQRVLPDHFLLIELNTDEKERQPRRAGVRFAIA
jgi:hypothetical protein